METRITLTPRPAGKAPAPCPECRRLRRRYDWILYVPCAGLGAVTGCWAAAAGVGFPGMIAVTVVTCLALAAGMGLAGKFADATWHGEG